MKYSKISEIYNICSSIGHTQVFASFCIWNGVLFSKMCALYILFPHNWC